MDAIGYLLESLSIRVCQQNGILQSQLSLRPINNKFDGGKSETSIERDDLEKYPRKAMSGIQR